jgi:uncharacterized membrane protein (DUF373 family)
MTHRERLPHGRRFLFAAMWPIMERMTKTLTVYFSALVVLLAVLVADMQGNALGLYQSWWPFDILMHIAGGIGIGLFLYALIGSFYPHIRRKKRAVIWGVFVVGIVWELFEIWSNTAGYTLWTVPYYIDTAKDLFDDVIGAGLVAWLVMKPQHKDNAF